MDEADSGRIDMGIVNDIADCSAEYQRRTGRPPTRLYLGEARLPELIRFITPFLIYPCECVEEKFNGMSLCIDTVDTMRIGCCE